MAEMEHLRLAAGPRIERADPTTREARNWLYRYFAELTAPPGGLRPGAEPPGRRRRATPARKHLACPPTPHRDMDFTGMDFDLTIGCAILERTPHTLRAMLAGLPSVWTDATEGPETWSPTVIVGHLIHGERTDWIPRARIILAQGPERRFEPFDRFAQLRECEGMSLSELLDEFARLRRENLATLAAWRLTDAQLALEGEHPELGPVTLRQLLATWVAHDLGHVAQTARVMAKQYRGAVGPWRAYLPILDR